VQKSLEIARLEAQINKNWDAYQKQPRRKFIGARTQEYRFAQYIEDWRIKVERIGNLNYPSRRAANSFMGNCSSAFRYVRRQRGKHGSQSLFRAPHPRCGSDAHRQTRRTVFPAAPNITKDIDILTITRTWAFTSSDRLESE